MKQILFNTLLLLVLAFGATQRSWGQGATTAAMSGKIVDSKGEALPGATVIAVHTPTNTQYVAPTNADGRFNIQNMRVGGPYSVKVTFVGYQDLTRDGINLSLGQNFHLDGTMSDASTELASVTVTGRRDPVINAGRTGAATTVQREQIERLPTISRSLQDFTRLTPQSNGNSLSGRNGRFNNIQIDGASNNDLFGLGSTGTPGGQAGTNPISLDAIQELQVVIAPYDVRQGRFSGGGINAVTRSGTNEFSGSVFAFGRNQNTAGRSPTPDPATGERTKLAEFYDYQTGFRLGGPIVKDKLFFFVNGEITRRSAPLLFRPANALSGGGNETGSNIVSFVNNTELQQISDKLREYGYDAGTFGEINAETRSNKVFARLDWNISANHQLTLRHNFVDASDDNITRSQTNFRFGNNGYQFLSKNNSTVLELKSRFGSSFANNLLIGYSTIRDSRTTLGALFPSITITAGNGTINAGSEFSSVANRLDQDILEINDNFNIFAGKHVLTIGTNNEIFRFDNLFVQSTEGRYDFPSIAAFLNNTASGTGFRYRQNFALPGGKPTAKFGAAQFGVYVQDEYNIFDNFRLTGGVRLDMPFYFDTPTNNPKVESTFATGTADAPAYDVNTTRLPKSRLQVSPRLGFNWDVRKNQTLQIRGGIGVFTGRPAYVWISNQYGNTGADFATFDSNNNTAPAAGYGLTNNYTALRNTISSTPLSAAKGSIAVTDRDFRNPQLLRTNVAFDYLLPLGIVATVEGIYSKTLNDVLPIDINLAPSNGTLQGDGRPVYPSGTARFRNSTDFNNVILLTNTSQGYQYSVTGELKKQLSSEFFASTAYTYGQSRDLYSGSSSTPVSTWEFNPHVAGPNNLELSYSNFDLRHRVIGSLSYRKTYAKHFATTLSAFYNGQAGSPFSYTYFGGDINNDGGQFTSNSNDLIYIPRTREEIVLVTAGTTDRRTPDQIWNELNSFIENDSYLNGHRGEYAARNGARTPWQHRVDMRLMQDIYMTIGSKTHTLQLTVDVTNVGNLLNSNWGRDYFVANQNYGLLRYQGLENGTTGRPTFSYGTGTSTTATEAYQISQLTSRWQAQFGVRYLF
jgi:outer membrane receptor for ferrienterochelin and colicin